MITRDFQLDFDGLLMGDGTPYGVDVWDGFLDMPPTRSTTAPRPGRRGVFTTPDYDDGKLYSIVADVVAAAGVTFADAVAALTAGTYPQETLRPLRFQLPGLGVRTVFVQCRKRVIPVDVAYEFGMSSKCAVQWFAPDGRQYGPSLSLAAGLRSGGTGLDYPLVYPLLYGTAPVGGVVTFTNTGNAAAEPVITVTGPLAQGFEIVRVETGRRLRYQAIVGSDLVLDCGAGTVTTQGQQRAVNLTVREWFTVAPGAVATFSFSTLGSETAASTPTAGMTVTIAPAYV